MNTRGNMANSCTEYTIGSISVGEINNYPDPKHLCENIRFVYKLFMGSENGNKYALF